MTYTHSMKLNKKNILIGTALLLIVFSKVAKKSIASADVLIIHDDGNIELVILNNVLGASTTAPKEQAKTSTPQPQSNTHQQDPQPQHTEQKQSPPPSNTSVSQTPVKTVPLVSPHKETSVQINPPSNNDKKVQVIITTRTTVSSATSPVSSPHTTQITINRNAQSTPQPTINPLPKNAQPSTTPQATVVGNISPSISPSLPTSVSSETVDQVVAQGSNGKPVISVTSSQAHELTIQQGKTQATTSLPLLIDTVTHSISVLSESQSAVINVLPSEALQGVMDNGLLNTVQADQAKINLSKDISGINYTVSSQKRGKLLGIFPVQSLVQVVLSAQTGKVVKASQSFLFNNFGEFIY